MTDRWVLELVLDGIEYRREQLDRDSATIREMTEPVDVIKPAKPVKVKVPAAQKSVAPDQFMKETFPHLKPKKKRKLSAEARERIAAAQRKRHAATRAAKAA